MLGLVSRQGLPIASAEFQPTTYRVTKTLAAPTIDGDASDAIWRYALTLDRFYKYQSGGDPAATPTSAKFLWDEQFLYVLLQMTDVDIRSACKLGGECGNDANLFDGDVIELFIKERAGRTRYFEFEWSPLNEMLDARFENLRDPRWDTPPGIPWDAKNCTTAVTIHGTGDDPSDVDVQWTVEVAIPFSNFEQSGFGVGSQWFFTVARYDYFRQPEISNPAMMMSTPGDPDAPDGGVTFGFHSYEIYDRCEFARSRCDVNGDDRCDLTDLNALLASGPIAPGIPAVPGKNAQFDLNEDGTIDLADRDRWLGEAAAQSGLSTPYRPGDANLDGIVDGQDFMAWNAAKFSHTLKWSNGDFNGDGVVDGADFQLWNKNKFTAPNRQATIVRPGANGIVADLPPEHWGDNGN